MEEPSDEPRSPRSKVTPTLDRQTLKSAVRAPAVKEPSRGERPPLTRDDGSMRQLVDADDDNSGKKVTELKEHSPAMSTNLAVENRTHHGDA